MENDAAGNMLTTHNLFALWIFGFISGFTLLITGNTLNYWLAKESIDLKAIGIFAIIAAPYSINFLWAAIFDTVKLGKFGSYFGHRLSWILIIQFFLVLSVFALSIIHPAQHLILFAAFAFVVSLLGSAQDTILGAFRTEIISKESQGAASGIYIFGYRIGMLLSGSGAIYLSTYFTFNQIYTIFAACVLIYSLILFLSTIRFSKIQFPMGRTGVEPLRQNIIPVNMAAQEDIILVPTHLLSMTSRLFLKYSSFFYNFVRAILQPIGSPSYIILILFFLILYRLPDNFINVMINPFLIKLGYNALEISSTGKFFGVIGAIIGGLLASYVMKRKTIIDSLFLFGIMHAGAHILFIVQEIYGKNMTLLFLTIGFESVTGGMSMAAYIAFIASLCHGKFRATQYSFFSSMMGFSRAIFPAISGYIVIDFGWQNFFIFTTIISLPPLLMLTKIREKFNP